MKKLDQLKKNVNLEKKPVGKELAPKMLSEVSGGSFWGRIGIIIRF